MRIVSYSPIYREALLDISLRAWGPVFPRMHNDVPKFVYDAFYPQGWSAAWQGAGMREPGAGEVNPAPGLRHLSVILL